ncbi:MAG: hypothetical protein Q9187_004207 [Circinaria calcarea]
MPSPRPQGLLPLPLPPGLSERQVTSPALDLSLHVIEAGSKGTPLVLLLHGFPELAFSWRKVLPGLAQAGFYAVAVDQRGYGRTTGWDTRDFQDVDLKTFSVTTVMRDMVVLVHALGYDKVHCLVGHDFGAVAASLCALARPDLFHKVILMSHPFKGIPTIPFDVSSSPEPEPRYDIHHELANLLEPRKHYEMYYSTAAANADMSPKEGLYEFFRGYFHLKSADWEGNRPHPLKSMTATELAEIPYYYIMPLMCDMREVVSECMNTEDPAMVQERSSRWLPDSELVVYVSEYGRTGFQGGLNWYRVQTDSQLLRDLDMFAGKKVEVPCLFIAGSKDWGVYQEPGVLERMSEVCSEFHGVTLIDGAGHWVQQEQPEKVTREIINPLIRIIINNRVSENK